jgi:hypothetical protein
VSYVWGPYPLSLVLDWHDGDTCSVDVDLGFGMFLKAYNNKGEREWSCRITGPNGKGFNAPELELKNPDGTYVHDPVTGKTVPNPDGYAAQAWAQQLCPSKTLVAVTSYSLDRNGGRFNAALTLPNGHDFATDMVAANHGVWKDYS